MSDNNLQNSSEPTSEDNVDTLYPMFFSLSCAFFALNLLPETDSCDEKWVEIRNKMLTGSAHLLGLFVSSVQKRHRNSELLHELTKQVFELKKRRSEDARANERVVSIFAAREQTWLEERRKLRQQICSLEAKNAKSLSELKETESALESKGEALEEAQLEKRDSEEKLQKLEALAAELKENLEKETQRRVKEISKHKTAFIEVVSNQRRVEAELGRALRQVEAAKEESFFMAQKFSADFIKIGRELEQKDQILSAVLRKSKLDAAEKEMLLKEAEASRAFSEPKHEMQSLKNTFASRRGLFSRRDYYIEYRKPEIEEGHCVLSLASEPYFGEESGEPGDDEDRVISDAETRNYEFEAFAEKLEAFQWRLVSKETESRRLKSRIEGLDRNIAHLREENAKLESLLRNREEELNSLKEQLISQFNPPNLQKLNLNSSTHEESSGHGFAWSKVKIVRRKPCQKITQEINTTPKEIFHEKHRKDIVLTLKPPIKEKKQETKWCALIGPNHSRREIAEGSAWKMDIRALGVSYKIKRLKQQLLTLERLTGKRESSEEEERESNELNFGVKGFYALVSLLNRQIDRYHSLQEKIDDICRRMHEKNLNFSCEGSNVKRSEEETKNLEGFLDETFQLQRYIVATGQKLLEVQSKIESAFVIEDAEEIEKPEGFDVKRFADNIRVLLSEVQRGLEVRLSRIIGDIEGTLAFDGMLHLRR